MGRAQLRRTFVISRGVGLRRPCHSGRRLRESAWGLTPLHYATRNGKVEAAELLLSKGAAVDAKEKRGPGPQSGKQGQKSRLSNLEHFRKVFRAWNFEKRFAFSVNVWERCDFPPQKSWDQWSQCNILICFKRGILWAYEPCLAMSPWMTRVRIDSGYFRIVSAKLRSSEFRSNVPHHSPAQTQVEWSELHVCWG